ncbi:hypothetical protein FHG64_07620 [Antarcticibacterium flavum]|uniref:Uncharacterized protein n=1 Tax=Antarcticibacterium flavum TaxID=2058175 RepID=A0A5B7X103_9FLAO|nr:MULTISPECIES: hypothetical protein [Antarcticibacterium]QCY69274.1 hypothetical protein FHG64_07620 [Antarcticibacterium flavum]
MFSQDQNGCDQKDNGGIDIFSFHLIFFIAEEFPVKQLVEDSGTFYYYGDVYFCAIEIPASYFAPSGLKHHNSFWPMGCTHRY